LLLNEYIGRMEILGIQVSVKSKAKKIKFGTEARSNTDNPGK